MILQFTNPKTGKMEEQELKEGLLFGRKKADIVVSDPKVSSKHAKIISEDEKLYIIDQGSTNKIVYQGNRVEKLELFSGVQFYLGNVLFDVVDKNHPSFTMPNDLESDKDSHWSQLLESCLKEVMENANQVEREVYPLSMNVFLKSVAGPAKGTSFELCYGPRSFGNLDQDLCIRDWNLGETSFELVEHDKDLYLTTDYVGRVFVNNKSESTVKLNSGDRITLGQTELIVEVSSNERSI